MPDQYNLAKLARTIRCGLSQIHLRMNPVGIPDDLLIKRNAVPKRALMDVLVQAVDAAVLLAVNVQGG